MSAAMDVLNGRKDYDDVCIDLRELGPNGGNLKNPAQFPQHRRAEHNAPIDPETGLPGLHRFEKPDTATCGIKDEKYWHHMAAYMILAGRTNSEIAMAARVTPEHVSHVRGQRWFQILLGTLANRDGEDYQAAINTHAHNAINRIAEIASGDVKELGVRNVLSANQLLVEHAMGKPTQRIVSSVSHTTHASPDAEMADIQQQLAALRSSATLEAITLPQSQT